MSKFDRVGLSALVIVCLFAGACAEGNSKASQEPGTTLKQNDVQDTAIPVEIEPLERGRIEAVLRYSTNLEAENAVAVHSQASRQVRELLVEEGDRVARGQVLLRLVDEEQQSAVARVQSQLAKAQREYQRQQSLFAQDLISEQAFSEATYELEQLQISLDDAQRELSYTTVSAPIAGIVTQRLVSLGDHVSLNDHLFDIVDFNSIVARIFVPEKELPRLHRAQPARIFAGAAGAESHRGKIERIAPTVDPRSGTVKVTLAIPHTDGLLPGMYVEVELVAEVVDDALLLPKRSLLFDQDQLFAFRCVGDGEGDPCPRVERVLIAGELEDQESVAVSETVFSEGDRIVVAGQAGLKDGARVRVLGTAPSATPEPTS